MSVLRCPDPSCNAPFGENMVNLLVSEECKKKFYQYFVRSYVEGNSNVKWCPTPDCGAAIEYIGDDGKVEAMKLFVVVRLSFVGGALRMIIDQLTVIRLLNGHKNQV